MRIVIELQISNFQTQWIMVTYATSQLFNFSSLVFKAMHMHLRSTTFLPLQK